MSVSHIADGTTSGYVQIGNNWAAGSGILVVDGRTSRVGIGTNSPDNLLEIQTESGSGVTGNDGIFCLLYTSPSPRDRQKSRMPSSA